MIVDEIIQRQSARHQVGVAQAIDEIFQSMFSQVQVGW